MNEGKSRVNQEDLDRMHTRPRKPDVTDTVRTKRERNKDTGPILRNQEKSKELKSLRLEGKDNENQQKKQLTQE